MRNKGRAGSVSSPTDTERALGRKLTPREAKAGKLAGTHGVHDKPSHKARAKREGTSLPPHELREMARDCANAARTKSAGEGGRASTPAPVRRSLPADVKRHAVVLFAQYQTLSAVGKAIREDYGITVDRRTLKQYDCASATGRVGKALRALFDEARKAYLADTFGIGIAHQNQRLRMLDRMAHKAEERGDYALAAQLLAQGAKELGGLVDQQRVHHTGVVGNVHMSVDDARAELAMRLNRIAETIPLQRLEKSADPATDLT